MGLADRVIELAMTVVLIVGGYQFYFWAQRQNFRPAAFLGTRFDNWIAYDARWVWVYSGLYYPMILLAALSVPTWRDFAFVVGCFLTLLAIQVNMFLWWPTEIPAQWRKDARAGWIAKRGDGTWSQRFLDFVWSYDKLRNGCPSMHVSMAMMTDLTISAHWPMAAYVGWLFPVLIAASALKTKQHYVVDVVPGAVTGAAVFFGWRWLMGG